MKKFGIRVFVKNNNEYGEIINRLDSQHYQVWLDSQSEVIIGPNEFIEIEKGEDKNE